MDEANGTENTILKELTKKHQTNVLSYFPYPSVNLLNHLPRVLDHSNPRLQKETAFANEESYIVIFNKKELRGITNANIAEDSVEKMNYLKSLDLFKDLTEEHLMPIVNSLRTTKYTYG
jgi:hypothetical protein